MRRKGKKQADDIHVMLVVNVHLNAIFPADSINAGRHIGKGTAENWSEFGNVIMR